MVLLLLGDDFAQERWIAEARRPEPLRLGAGSDAVSPAPSPRRGPSISAQAPGRKEVAVGKGKKKQFVLAGAASWIPDSDDPAENTSKAARGSFQFAG